MHAYRAALEALLGSVHGRVVLEIDDAACQVQLDGRNIIPASEEGRRNYTIRSVPVGAGDESGLAWSTTLVVGRRTMAPSWRMFLGSHPATSFHVPFGFELRGGRVRQEGLVRLLELGEEIPQLAQQGALSDGFDVRLARDGRAGFLHQELTLCVG